MKTGRTIEYCFCPECPPGRNYRYDPTSPGPPGRAWRCADHREKKDPPPTRSRRPDPPRRDPTTAPPGTCSRCGYTVGTGFLKDGVCLACRRDRRRP